MNYYQINAFASVPFKGNPAGVMVLEEEKWANNNFLSKTAAELNLPATVFITDSETPKIKWFTPSHEIPLCGHGTLAAGAAMLLHKFPILNKIIFESPRAGKLPVYREGYAIVLDFPLIPVEELKEIPEVPSSWQVMKAYNSKNLILELHSELAVRNFLYDERIIKRLHHQAVVVTAPSSTTDYDFVSRVFEPQIGIGEDPVTGSAHCALAALWSRKLGKNKLKAFQASERTGVLDLEVKGNRVLIKGNTRKVIEGNIAV